VLTAACVAPPGDYVSRAPVRSAHRDCGRPFESHPAPHRNHWETVRAACSSGLPGCDSRCPAREARGTRTASRRPVSSTGNLLISEQPARSAGNLVRSLTALPFASEGSLRSPSRLAGLRPARGARRPQNALGVSSPVYKGRIRPLTRVYNKHVGRRLSDPRPT